MQSWHTLNPKLAEVEEVVVEVEELEVEEVEVARYSCHAIRSISGRSSQVVAMAKLQRP